MNAHFADVPARAGLPEGADFAGRHFLAAVGDALGAIDNYALRSVPHRALAPDEVRIAVRAAGVSFVDVLVAEGRYQARPETPFIPGSECAGIVVEAGSAAARFRVGQPVIATGWAGMFAEYVAVPEAAVFPMPGSLSFEEASVLAVSYSTAWHGLKDRGRLAKGETLLVLGAGGATGLAAIQLGVHLGARVIASASTEAKRTAALAAGAHAAVDSLAPDWRGAVQRAAGDRAIDVVFDPVGGSATEIAFRTLGWNGRHLVVGFPGGIAQFPTNLPLLKGASLVGVNLSQLGAVDPLRARDNTEEVIALADHGHVRPVIGVRYSLDRFADAMRHAAGASDAGRVVIQIEEGDIPSVPLPT